MTDIGRYLELKESLNLEKKSILQKSFESCFYQSSIMDNQARIVIRLTREEGFDELANEMQSDLESELNFKKLGV